MEASKTSQKRLLGQEVNASDATWMLDVPTLLPGVCVCVYVSVHGCQNVNSFKLTAK